MLIFFLAKKKSMQKKTHTFFLIGLTIECHPHGIKYERQKIEENNKTTTCKALKIAHMMLRR